MRFILQLAALLMLSSIALADACQDAVTLANPPPAGRVVLTFDDGPDPEFTPKILDILKKHKMKATFFLIGAKAKSYPSLVKRIYEEGHLIGNHSLTHQDFSNMDPDLIRRQILESRQIIGSILSYPGATTNHSIELFRFPEGKASCLSKKILTDNRMSYLGWNVDSCDWAFSDGVISQEEGKSCEIRPGRHTNLVESTLEQIKRYDGGVVLFHDNHKITADNLDKILTELKKENYRVSFPPRQDVSVQANNKPTSQRRAAN